MSYEDRYKMFEEGALIAQRQDWEREQYARADAEEMSDRTARALADLILADAEMLGYAAVAAKETGQ